VQQEGVEEADEQDLVDHRGHPIPEIGTLERQADRREGEFDQGQEPEQGLGEAQESAFPGVSVVPVKPHDGIQGVVGAHLLCIGISDSQQSTRQGQGGEQPPKSSAIHDHD
jgi:hypothetical protein